MFQLVQPTDIYSICELFSKTFNLKFSSKSLKIFLNQLWNYSNQLHILNQYHIDYTDSHNNRKSFVKKLFVILLDTAAAEILFMRFCFYEDSKNYDPLSKTNSSSTKKN